MNREENLLAVLAARPNTGTTRAAELMRVCRGTALRAVQTLLASHEIHIGAWETQAGNKGGGGSHRPLYALGDLPHAPRPPCGDAAAYHANRVALLRDKPAVPRKPRPTTKTAVEHVQSMPAYPKTWTLHDLCEVSGLQPYYAKRATYVAAKRNLLDVVRRGSNGNVAIYRLKANVQQRHVGTITPSVNSIFNLGQAL